MRAWEADVLRAGDAVLAKNGIYVQRGTVINVEKDAKGIRRIYYSWRRPNGIEGFAIKRHTSVYLPAK